MTKKLPLIAVLISALFMMGCSEKDDSAEKTGKKIDDTYKEIKSDAKEMAHKTVVKIEEVKDKASDAWVLSKTKHLMLLILLKIKHLT